MLTMAVGQSDDVEPTRAMAEVIEQCRGQLNGLAPRAGILLCAMDSFDPELIDQVRVAFPGVAVMGSTSAAGMSSTSGMQEDSIQLSLLATDDIEIGTGIGVGVDEDVEAACRAAVDQALDGLAGEPKVCLVISEPMNAQRVAETLRQVLPAGMLVLGGGAGRDDLRGYLTTYQFCNNEVTTHGAAIMVLAGNVAFSTAVGTGWRVLGPQGVVTRAEYGVISEIDGKPAADFLRGYIDPGAGGAFGNPLAIRDEGSADWYLRVVLGADGAGGLAISGAVPVGASVQLTTTDPESMLGATAEAVERARAAFPAEATPSAALVFSCAVRKVMLGTRVGQEVASMSSLLPATPIAGMYCIGEIAPTGAAPGSHFLNETFVALLLGG